MSILIKDVQARMSQIGISTSNSTKRKVMYMPSVTVEYEDFEKKPCHAYIGELLGKFKKSDFLGSVICGEFFVLIFKLEWEIISPECKLIASMPPSGEIIAVKENHFIVRNNNIITGYDIEGKNVGSRELTAEEMNTLDNK